MKLISKFLLAGRIVPGNQALYDHVTTLYQKLVDKGVSPQVALELVNLKVAEKGWTGWSTGDNKKYPTVDAFVDHLIDWHSRMYPNSLKAKNFDEFYEGVNGTKELNDRARRTKGRDNSGRYYYNTEKEWVEYKNYLLKIRPGVIKRINHYRALKGLTPLAYIPIQEEVQLAKGGTKVKTRAGIQTSGSFVKLRGEDFYRRVNSDGTLTEVKDGEDGTIKYDNTMPSNVRNSAIQRSRKKSVNIGISRRLLKNTEGAGNVFYDGLSIITNLGGDNTYYDGKFHFNGNTILTNIHNDSNRNLINLYTNLNELGFVPSQIGVGRYEGTKYSELPAYQGKFYGDTIYLPEDTRDIFNSNIGNSYNVNKDELVTNAPLKYIDNTDDVRNHYMTIGNNNVIFEDVWDINRFIDRMNYPFILNLKVPVVFTNDESKTSRFPSITKWFLDLKSK